MSTILHSSESPLWGTPKEILELAKLTLGEIDCDPCSSEEHNKLVGAKYYFSEEDDSLGMPFWVKEGPCSIFINPPSGKYTSLSKPLMFWHKLTEHRFYQKLTHAIFLGFSLEQLPQSQDCFWSFTDFPTLLPRKRIKFEDPTSGNRSSPTHSNFITYVPGSIDNTSGFINTFGHLGKFIKTYK